MSSIAILGCARNIAKYWNESVSTLKTISNQCCNRYLKKNRPFRTNRQKNN